MAETMVDRQMKLLKNNNEINNKPLQHDHQEQYVIPQLFASMMIQGNKICDIPGPGDGRCHSSSLSLF